jgi:methylmalonyl-CoA/ethylmalonyl-CoA epimerase
MTTTAAGPVQLSTIGQIAIAVHDIAKATAFYRDVLGMRFLFEAPPHLAFFDCDGVRLMLSKPEQAELEPPGSVLYFKVPDIDATFQALRERGVKFEGEPHLIAKMPDYDLWMAFFRDLDGNLLALMCEKRG